MLSHLVYCTRRMNGYDPKNSIRDDPQHIPIGFGLQRRLTLPHWPTPDHSLSGQSEGKSRELLSQFSSGFTAQPSRGQLIAVVKQLWDYCKKIDSHEDGVSLQASAMSINRSQFKLHTDE